MKKPRYWVRWGKEIITGLIIAVIGAYLIGEGRFSPKATSPSGEDTAQKSFLPTKEPKRTDPSPPTKKQEMAQPSEKHARPGVLAPGESTPTRENEKSTSISSTPSKTQELTQPSETPPARVNESSEFVGSQKVMIGKSSNVAVPPKDFGNLLVTLSSLKAISDNSVIADLSFLNKTGKDIVAALDTYQLDIKSHKSGVFLTDNSGNKYELKESSGIGEKAMSQFQGGDKSGRWLICLPGVEMSVSLSFAHPRNMETRGSTLSTSIPIVVGRFYKDNWGDDRFELQYRLNIQFSNVSLR
jgi:hypothetical protein